MGTQNFFFIPRSWQGGKHPSLFLYRAQNLHLSCSIYKHDAINIADPNSMQDMCHMNFVIDLAHWSLWLNGRALEQGIQRSDVWFLMGNQNVFFVSCFWQDKKHLSLFFTELKTYNLSYSIYKLLLYFTLVWYVFEAIWHF